jgi:hypothetical protein
MKLLTILAVAVSAFVISPSSFAQAPATPAPLIPAPPAPSARTLADKQAAATQRIDQALAGLQNAIKFAVAGIDREIQHNREGLTPDQVIAGLGADKAASLAQAKADLITLANKYAPGTFPTP